MMNNKVEVDFIRGQSDNLPKVDALMVFDYLSNSLKFTSAEIRGWKRSTHEIYGDDAVGNVQVKRQGDICLIKAKVTPEKGKAYSCTFSCDEKEEMVLKVECHDCATKTGGCKHSVAFLIWLHRRSEEPSSNEIRCYWAEPKLASFGTTSKFIKAKDMGPRSSVDDVDEATSKGFFQAVVQTINKKSIKNKLSNYV